MSSDQGSQPGNADVRHIGADITKSDAVLIVVDGNGLPVVDPWDILAPSEHGSPAEVLLELKSRVIEHLRRLGSASISVYGPAKYANWKFHDLRPRCQIEATLIDVVPQARGLRLTINLDLHDLHDPRGLAKDVTNVGRWGNGNVEVMVDTEESIPYVMGLIRQAFERQMGNSEDGS